MEQIFLNFDATEFDAFESTQEYFAHRSRCLKDDRGNAIKGHYQAAMMDYAPSQWSSKLNEGNNTCITLNDADKHTELFGDTSWIDYLYWKHVLKKKRNRDQLLELKRQIERELEAAEQ